MNAATDIPQVTTYMCEPVAVRMRDACQLLGVCDEEYVRRLARAGKIRSRKLPGTKTVLYSVQSIHEYMGDRT